MDKLVMPREAEIIFTQEGGVATVIIDRPRKRNALSQAMWARLQDIFEQLSTGLVRAVILTGSGGSFCAGADIAEFDNLRGSAELASKYEIQVDGALNAIASCPVPVIAAVSGICLGGGLALAAACDFRIADSTASFGVPAARLGLIYNVEKCRSVFNLVGLANAKRILLCAARTPADEALSMGLVDQLATADVLKEAEFRAKQFLDVAPLSVAGMKGILQSIAAAEAPRFTRKFDNEIARADSSEDHREAVRAFAEKRRPHFVGR